jgi:hypothetical protein
MVHSNNCEKLYLFPTVITVSAGPHIYSSTVKRYSFSITTPNKHYIKSLYKHTLENECNWVVHYDLYRVCTEFECNWYIVNLLHMQCCRLTSSPFCSEEIFTVPVCSALAAILEKAKEELAHKCHPGPYICVFRKLP